jgi:hypothetical protein
LADGIEKFTFDSYVLYTLTSPQNFPFSTQSQALTERS